MSRITLAVQCFKVPQNPTWRNFLTSSRRNVRVLFNNIDFRSMRFRRVVAEMVGVFESSITSRY